MIARAGSVRGLNFITPECGGDLLEHSFVVNLPYKFL